MPDKPLLIRRTHAIHDFDMSYEEIKKGWQMPYMHRHISYEIYLLLYGERIVTIGEEHYLVHSGHATLFGSEVPHCSRGETDFSGICISFTIELLKQYFKQSTIHELLRCFDHPIICVPPDYQQTLLEMTLSHSYASEARYLKLAQLLYDFECFHRQQPYEESAYNISTPNAAKRLMEYIDSNYTQIYSISDISTALDISEAYVYKVLQKEKGMTPKDYINQLRIHHALRELEYSSHTVSAIAEVSGYQSVNYFIRIFRSYVGMTPTQFRRQLSQS